MIAARYVTVENRPKPSRSIKRNVELEVIVKLLMVIQEQESVIPNNAVRIAPVNGVISVLAARSVIQESNKQYLSSLITNSVMARSAPVRRLKNAPAPNVMNTEDSREKLSVEEHAKHGIHKPHKGISKHQTESQPQD